VPQALNSKPVSLLIEHSRRRSIDNATYSLTTRGVIEGQKDSSWLTITSFNQPVDKKGKGRNAERVERQEC